MAGYSSVKTWHRGRYADHSGRVIPKRFSERTNPFAEIEAKAAERKAQQAERSAAYEKLVREED